MKTKHRGNFTISAKYSHSFIHMPMTTVVIYHLLRATLTCFNDYISVSPNRSAWCNGATPKVANQIPRLQHGALGQGSSYFFHHNRIWFCTLPSILSYLSTRYQFRYVGPHTRIYIWMFMYIHIHIHTY